MNIALILEYLRRDAPLSRTHLAQLTGLNKATVTSLVRELLESDFVHESGTDVGDIGRPAIRLSLNPRAGYIIGAEIGVDFVLVILTNFSGDVVWRRRETTRPRERQEVVLDLLDAVLQDACQYAHAQGMRLLGLGLGVPGLVDVTAGTLLFAPNLGWADVPLKARLQRKFKMPIEVANEANLAALGESYFGAARGVNFVLYVSAGIGLGGGIVLNREVLPGAAGFAGEVGHMTMDPNGAQCNCGNFGCWETFVSQWAVFRRVREAVEGGRPSTLTTTCGGDWGRLTVPDVVDAARAGDGVARDALAETGRYLGIGLANLINALNPERVVLGGALCQGHAFLMPSLTAEVERRALRASRDKTEIVVATYGTEASVMGGVASIFHRILSQPLEVTRAEAVAPPTGAARR
ncbi:MAG TPA: ROK family transcriptional regulator [Anaerolineales bacterium]|nr:ROK family transcriptional regulator [Anaerolineales bacterium]